MVDVARGEQALLSDFMRPVTYPSGKTFYLPTLPIEFRQCGKPGYPPAIDVGAHTREVLMKHGYSKKDIAALAEGKAIQVSTQCSDREE